MIDVAAANEDADGSEVGDLHHLEQRSAGTADDLTGPEVPCFGVHHPE